MNLRVFSLVGLALCASIGRGQDLNKQLADALADPKGALQISLDSVRAVVPNIKPPEFPSATFSYILTLPGLDKRREVEFASNGQEFKYYVNESKISEPEKKLRSMAGFDGYSYWCFSEEDGLLRIASGEQAGKIKSWLNGYSAYNPFLIGFEAVARRSGIANFGHLDNFSEAFNHFFTPLNSYKKISNSKIEIIDRREGSSLGVVTFHEQSGQLSDLLNLSNDGKKVIEHYNVSKFVKYVLDGKEIFLPASISYDWIDPKFSYRWDLKSEPSPLIGKGKDFFSCPVGLADHIIDFNLSDRRIEGVK